MSKETKRIFGGFIDIPWSKSPQGCLNFNGNGKSFLFKINDENKIE
jgi:hypothetical protein